MTIFFTQMYTMAIKIFTSHKKNVKKCLCPFNKKSFSNCQTTYQKELYFLLKKLGNFFHRVNTEIGLSPLPLFIFSFTLLRTLPPFPFNRWKEFMIVLVYSCI